MDSQILFTPKMPEITTIIFDNALNSQNQDYLPSRIILQKEVIDSVITRVLESDPESLVGLIPLCQIENNDILTPTKSRPHLSTFLHEKDLHHNIQHVLSLYHADQSLYVSDLSNKTLILFLCTPVKEFEEVFSDIYNIASKGVVVKVVCFGDAMDMGVFMKDQIDIANFTCCVVDTSEDFVTKVQGFLGADLYNVDPELEEAIRRSMREQ
jgi:26S proteasome regulatory subunit N10